jgi:rfaE bifunctional protein nucleotidyltransferase chain/domain
MNKVIKINQLNKLVKNLKSNNKTIVLVGGCFDLFHYGHFQFLKLAKELGDVLIIALEHDLTVKKLKGRNRPLTPQNARAQILAGFSFVDYVILLPDLQSDEDYQNLTNNIKPDFIALTEGDRQQLNKQKFAKMVNAKVVAIPSVQTRSTTDLLKLINNNSFS